MACFCVQNIYIYSWILRSFCVHWKTRCFPFKVRNSANERTKDGKRGGEWWAIFPSHSLPAQIYIGMPPAACRVSIELRSKTIALFLNGCPNLIICGKGSPNDEWQHFWLPKWSNNVRTRLTHSFKKFIRNSRTASACWRISQSNKILLPHRK